MEKIKVSIIGLGKMGNLHAKTILKNPNFQLHGIYDIDYYKISSFCATHNISDLIWFDSAKECLDNSDAVIIATPATTHAEILNHSGNCKYILCEKPFVYQYQSIHPVLYIRTIAPTMLENVVTHVGHGERHHPATQELRRAVQNSEEPPVHIAFIRHSTANRNTDVNLLWDTMVHDIDLLYYILGDKIHPTPTSIKPILIQLSDDASVDRFECLINFDSLENGTIGRQVRVLLSCGKNQQIQKREVAIEIGKNYFNLIDYNSPEYQQPKDNLTIQLEEFHKAILRENTENCTMSQAKKVIELVEKIDVEMFKMKTGLPI